MMKRIRTFLRDDGGSTVVEMGLAAPFLASLLVGMVDLSRAYSTKLQVEQAAQRTIEKVMQQKSVESDYTAALKAEGASAAGVPASAVTPDAWLECDGTRVGGLTSECPSGTLTYARYVTVVIAKEYTPLFSTKYFPGASVDGTYTLRGKAGIRIQ